MNCAYHPDVSNVAYCIRCGRALCAECVRNVRGSVYCENCLAELVGGAKAPPSNSPPKVDSVAGTNPGAAFALGLIPGVGAIYNGEYVKAAVHVLIFGTLISLQGVTRVGEPLFGLMTFAFYCYMPFEAYYTAKKRKMRAEGIELETPIDRFQQQFGETKDKNLWGGIALVVLGGLFLMGNFDVLDLERVGRLWPIVLVIVGLWLLKKHQEKTT